MNVSVLVALVVTFFVLTLGCTLIVWYDFYEEWAITRAAFPLGVSFIVLLILSFVLYVVFETNGKTIPEKTPYEVYSLYNDSVDYVNDGYSDSIVVMVEDKEGAVEKKKLDPDTTSMFECKEGEPRLEIRRAQKRFWVVYGNTDSFTLYLPKKGD